MANTPILVYLPSTTTEGLVGMECFAVGGSAQSFAPFLHGGNLFYCGQLVGNAVSPAKIYMLKSTDSGATWNILDLANSPSTSLQPAPIPPPNGSALLDTTLQIVTVCYNDADLNVPANRPVKLRDFDLVTETWGLDYGTVGAPSVFNCNQLFRRADTSLVFIQTRRPFTNTVVATVFAAGVWSGPIALTSNLPAGQNNNGSSSACLDASDTIHIFMFTKDGSSLSFCTYQQLLSSNALGPFFNFTNEFGNLGTGNLGQIQMGDPIISGSNLVWGVIDVTGTVPTVMVGTPLAAPVFTVLPSPGIDAGFPAGSGSVPQPTLGTNGLKIFAVYVFVAPGGVNSLVRMAQTSNVANPATGWTAEEIYDDSVGTVKFLRAGQYPSVRVIAGSNPLVMVQGPSAGGLGQPTAYFMQFGGTAAITCDNPPAGRTGLFYSHAFPASGGTPPYTFSIIAGELPTGLTLDAATGIVSGVPSQPGLFSFTIQVTDSAAGVASVACSIAIANGGFFLSGAAAQGRYCPPVPAAKVDWSAFAREFDALRPADVEEVQVPCAPPIVRRW